MNETTDDVGQTGKDVVESAKSIPGIMRGIWRGAKTWGGIGTIVGGIAGIGVAAVKIFNSNDTTNRFDGVIRKTLGLDENTVISKRATAASAVGIAASAGAIVAGGLGALYEVRQAAKLEAEEEAEKNAKNPQEGKTAQTMPPPPTRQPMQPAPMQRPHSPNMPAPTANRQVPRPDMQVQPMPQQPHRPAEDCRVTSQSPATSLPQQGSNLPG